MSKYNWKDTYYDHQNVDIYTIPTLVTVLFFSPLGSKDGDGTRDNPCNTSIYKTGYNDHVWILSGGSYDFAGTTNFNNGSPGVRLIGQGKHATKITFNLALGGYSAMHVMDLTLLALKTVTSGGTNIYRCIIEGDLSGSAAVYYTIVKYNCLSKISGNYNSIMGITLTSDQGFKLNNSLFQDCSISVLAADITGNYRNYYLGFDNCKFKIEREDDYTYLSGETAEEMHADFLERCRAQGITPPTTTDLNVTSELGRWFFCKGSAIEGRIIKGSEMDNFRGKLFIQLGCEEEAIELLPVTLDTAMPASFNPENPKSSSVVVNEDSLNLDTSFSITEKSEAYIDSNIIWLGGKQKLSAIDILNNLPMENGVSIDSTPSLGENPVTVIEAGKNYLVRSADNQPATLQYNNKTYDTSLVTRNNIFRGVEDVSSFEVASGNPVVYEVLDYAINHSIQIRIVEDLPAGEITSGNLVNGCWYFVAPNNLNDTQGTVIYNGKEYPCFGSFLVKDVLTFSVNGSCHLRRCWMQDYSLNDAQDKSFWQDRQKPLWADVVPNDLRCLMETDSAYDREMKKDLAGNYIASGHPDFYNNITGETGIRLPAYDITGAFLQVRIPVTSLNPM